GATCRAGPLAIVWDDQPGTRRSDPSLHHSLFNATRPFLLGNRDPDGFHARHYFCGDGDQIGRLLGTECGPAPGSRRSHSFIIGLAHNRGGYQSSSLSYYPGAGRIDGIHTMNPEDLKVVFLDFG